MLQGHQTWVFQSQPVIASSATVVGPFEAKSPFMHDFDIIHGDTWLGQDSWEKAEKRLLEEACEKAIEKAGIEKEEVQFFLGGDLMAQIITSSFAARTLAIPYIGIFGACSTSMEGLALAALLIDSANAERVMCATSSHNSATEKQFRYPTEYGGQKPPTAQWTVTGAGAAIVERNSQKFLGKPHLKVTAATIGKVVDMGISDPFNMGAAMAPAAVDTITAHFRDLNRTFSDYDLVVTGDLAKVGYEIAHDLFEKHGMMVPEGMYKDCGVLFYGDLPEVIAGGSGCGCSATLTYGHLFKLMLQGKLKKILVAATGALLSPISYQQNESIPCICHAVSIEFGN